MNRKKIKEFLKYNPSISNFLSLVYNNLPFNNRFKIGRANLLENKGILKHCKINIRGKSNLIQIGSLVRLTNTAITVSGNNNRIVIDDNSLIVDGELYIEDDYGCIEIGSGTEICGKTHLAVIEGTKISIGKNCLFSSSVVVRTGDSHSILDNNGNRVNPSNSVTIGNHVWIGNQVIILKGSEIQENSIVGSGALVTKRFVDTNIIIGGSPAKIIKENVSWCGERIDISKK